MASTRELEILLKIRDEFTGKMAGVQKSLDETTKSTKSAQASVQSFTGGLKSMAASFGLVLGVRSIVEFFKTSATAAGESETAMAQLGAVIRSTGGAAGVTAEQAIKLAQALQQTSVYSDEAAMGAENLLLTFTNIKADIFPAALKIVADMSTALGQDLKSSAIQVGKALQDPILGVTALRRVGVNFNETQTETIKKMVEAGQGAEAQAMIMRELNKEFGGSAQAEVETYAGQVAKLKNSFNDFQENIGRTVVPVLDAFFAGLAGQLDDANARAEHFAAVGILIRTTLQSWSLDLHTVPEKFGASFTELGANLKATGKLLKGTLLPDLGDLKGPQNAVNEFQVQTKKNEDEYRASVEKTQKDLEINKKTLSDMADTDLAKILKGLHGEGNAPYKKPPPPDFGSGSKVAKEETDRIKELTEAYKKLGSEYKKFADDADESLFQLKQSHDENMTSIQKEIDDTRKKLQDLKDEYRTTLKGIQAAREDARTKDTGDLAGAVVANEERIAEIQTELSKGVNKKRRAELEKELADRQKAVTDNASTIGTIQAQIDEAHRLAGLTDLQIAVEQFNQREALAQAEYTAASARAKKEYEEKKKAAEQDLKDQKKKMADEEVLYAQKEAFIKSTLQKVTEAQKAQLDLGLKNTKESIQTELDYYAELARAISYARSGNAAEVERIKTKVKDAVIAPDGHIITTDPKDFLIATKDPGSLVGGQQGGMTTIVLNLDGRQVAQVVLDRLAKDIKRDIRV